MKFESTVKFQTTETKTWYCSDNPEGNQVLQNEPSIAKVQHEKLLQLQHKLCKPLHYVLGAKVNVAQNPY